MQTTEIAKLESALTDAQAKAATALARKGEARTSDAFFRASQEHERAQRDVEFHSNVLHEARGKAEAAVQDGKRARARELYELLTGHEPCERVRPIAEKLAAALNVALAAIAELDAEVAEQLRLHVEGMTLAHEMGIASELPLFSNSDNPHPDRYGRIAAGVVACTNALRCARLKSASGTYLSLDPARWLALEEPALALQRLGFERVHDDRFPIAEQLEAALAGTFYDRVAQLQNAKKSA